MYQIIKITACLIWECLKVGSLHSKAALCQWLCGGIPAAWCWAKGSSRLMWVVRATTNLWFIYLGMKASIRETKQYLYVRGWWAWMKTGSKWHSHQSDTFPHPCHSFTHYWLISHCTINSATRKFMCFNSTVMERLDDTVHWFYICKMIYDPLHCWKLPSDFYLCFIDSLFPPIYFQWSLLYFSINRNFRRMFRGWSAEHANHSYNRKWAACSVCQYLYEESAWERGQFILMEVFKTEPMFYGCSNQGVIYSWSLCRNKINGLFSELLSLHSHNVLW